MSRLDPLMTGNSREKLYICPGEAHPISRSVHLSRLAAFYPKCRDCPLRIETGQLPTTTVKRLQSTEGRVQRKSLLTAEGVRGIYLNELTRDRAGKMAAALASLLWDASPLAGGIDSGKRPHRRARPAVVVGHDERPSSPGIVTGVATSLRRMGCQVIDVGLTSKPCFWFAVDHLQASAGIYVTGAGCGPSWTGLDFAGRTALPLSRPTGLVAGADSSTPCSFDGKLNLDRLEARLTESYSRPTRQAGPQRTFQASLPYEAGLWKHFHALRPLMVCCASPNRLVRATLDRIFGKLPCGLSPVEIPQRSRNLADPDDADVLRLGVAVRRTQAHLGVLIDDDACRCGFFDETGNLIAARDVTRLIAEIVLSEHPDGTFVVESSAVDGLRPVFEEAGARVIDGGGTLASMSQSMREHQAVYGAGHSGRYWFREAFPTCDAVLTVAKVLAALSRSDASFSDALRTARHSTNPAVNSI